MSRCASPYKIEGNSGADVGDSADEDQAKPAAAAAVTRMAETADNEILPGMLCVALDTVTVINCTYAYQYVTHLPTACS